jgi:hypothetical protein
MGEKPVEAAVVISAGKKTKEFQVLIRKCQIQSLPRFFFWAVVGVFLQRLIKFGLKIMFF